MTSPSEVSAELDLEADSPPGGWQQVPGISVATEPERFGPARFLNRELSWLDFAERVLDLAEDDRVPLLERVKFLAIFSTGLDEFFQVRVAGLKGQLEAGLRRRSPDGRTVSEQLVDTRTKTVGLFERSARIWTQLVHPELDREGIQIVDVAWLDAPTLSELREIFEREIFPVLTPLAVDPGHPFPYISNLSLNLAVIVMDPVTKDQRFARVKVPPLLPRFVPLSDGKRFVPLEQVISANLDELFPDMSIGDCHSFRVTRNADLELDEDEADDLLAAIEVELRRRRFGRAVRLELDPTMPSGLVELLREELELTADDCYITQRLLDLGQLWEIANQDRPELHEASWTPTTPPRLQAPDDGPVDIFEVLKERDLLVHHPYDSFATSVEAFITQAASDPDVLAIKQTLYRTSGDAPFVSVLARAAEAGKQVAALVEVKARFDEQRNILWARQLEEAGVHVVYGVVGLKTHSKTTLVIRREPDGIKRYCHVGTGNYNSDTARVYEDLGLLSADPAIGNDLSDLFNHLTGFSRPTTSRSLILSPEGFRPWVLEHIAKEESRGEQGRIAIKVNGLTDPEIIDALYGAAQQGVRIELIVRGVCSLRPGVAGLSETITVRSIVGRFLEHSRIYRFGYPSEEVLSKCNVSSLVRSSPDGVVGTYVIGSADLMERNLDRRIEALVPIRDPELCARLEDVLTLDLSDDKFAWSLATDGNWTRVPTINGISVQERLEELALERIKRRRTHDAAL